MAEPTHGEILAQLAELKALVGNLAADVAETKGMVEAWNAVKTGGKVISWLAKVGGALIALIVLAKTGAVALVEWGAKP